MPNVALTEVTARGSEAAVKAFLTDGEIAGAIKDTRIENMVLSGAERTSASFSMHSRWSEVFKAIENAARRHPDVVLTAAAVELANGNAEGRVYRGEEMVGSYSMPSEEIASLYGDEYEEEPVLNSLFATIASWEDDALRQIGPSANPSP